MGLQSDGFRGFDIMREFHELKRDVHDLLTARRLESASFGRGGIRVHDQGTIRSGDFDGDLAAGDAGQTGWALGDRGSAVFNTLTLRDRLITDDALAKPVDVAGQGDSATGFALSTTGTDLATVELPVPDWAGRALVWAWANASVGNPTAAADFVYIRAMIGAAGGGEMFAGAAGTPSLARWVNIFGSAQRLIDDPGDTIEVAVRMRTQTAGWSAETGNIANIDAAAIYLP